MFVQVNVGRNINDTPMSEAQWLMFRTEATDMLIDNVVRATGHVIDIDDIEYHYGTGYWGDVAEDSCHISAGIPAEYDDKRDDIIAALVDAATKLAPSYSQDMVGVMASA